MIKCRSCLNAWLLRCIVSRRVVRSVLRRITPRITNSCPRVTRHCGTNRRLASRRLSAVTSITVSVLHSVLSRFSTTGSPVSRCRNSRNRLVLSMATPSLTILVNHRNHALSTLRIVFSLLIDHGLNFECPIMISIRKCGDHHRSGITSVTRSTTRHTVHARGDISLPPVGTCRHQLIRVTLHNGSTISARSRNSSPSHRIIVITQWSAQTCTGKA